MKAISLWQPWATLIAIGAKQYETRSWSVTYRGPLVIHAAHRPAAYHQVGTPLLLKSGYRFLDSLPIGAALCVVDLVDIELMTDRLIDSVSEQEFALGDWTEGRYAWRLANVRPFPRPILMKGMQGLFDCDIPVEKMAAP